MAEKTLTPTEVAELIEMLATTLEATALATAFIIKLMPASTRTADEWVTTFANENVKHIRGVAKLARNS